MATIVVVGGTGYTGGNIVREAAARGHTVVSISRSKPSEPVAGVRYELGEVEEVAARVIPGADVVVAACRRGATWPVAWSRCTDSWRGCRPTPAPATCRWVASARCARLRVRRASSRVRSQSSSAQEALEGEATRVMLVEDSPTAPGLGLHQPSRELRRLRPGGAHGPVPRRGRRRPLRRRRQFEHLRHRLRDRRRGRDRQTGSPPGARRHRLLTDQGRDAPSFHSGYELPSVRGGGERHNLPLRCPKASRILGAALATQKAHRCRGRRTADSLAAHVAIRTVTQEETCAHPNRSPSR